MFLFLYAILSAIILFFVVIGVVNGWIRYRTWHDEDLLVGRIYTSRRMIWLYTKCWGILISGLFLAVLFDWLMKYLPDTLYDLTVEFRIVFYVLCGILTIASLMSVVNGETLVELRLRSAESENQLLKSQLNPHFLYNTLNNIDALIWLDQERASSAVNSLSSLMRYFTYSGKQEWVEIGEEVKHLTLLVELQRLRMPNPASLVFNVTLDDPKRSIAPLLLIPLIENCFKHCGDLSEDRAIEISITLADGVLNYHSDNNLKEPVEPQKKQPHGLGMKVLRRRLDLLYNDRFSLTLEKKEPRFVTDLTVVL